MFKMKDIDINIEGYNVNGICVGCLNYNRKMFYHEDIKECFSTLADINIPAGLSVQLCWECLAAVRRAWQFRSQLLMSYDILNCFSIKHTFLNSPSDLTQYSTTRLSLSKVEINEDTEFLPVLLKEESDNDTNQIKLDEDTDFQLVLLKEEIVDDTDQVKLDEDTELQTVLLKEDIDDDTDQVDFETLNTEDQIFDHDVYFQLEDFSQKPVPSSDDTMQISKLKQRKKVMKRRKSDEEGMLHLPVKRKSDNETEKKMLKSQAPLKNTYKSEENNAQNEDNSKIPDFEICSKKFNTLSKTIIPNNETTTSNINSDITNSKIEANSITAPNDIFLCDVCKEEYLCESLLKNHIKKCHIIEIDTKPNSQTDLNTNYQNSKNTNLLKGKDALKYKNMTENKLSKNKNKHKASICSDETQYKCSYCSKCFSDNSNLARHVRRHTVNRPHKCSYCSKCFCDYSTLSRHLRIHTGEKPFKCSYCLKSFTQNSTLATHVRFHTGEKPYKCSYCMKCFTTSSNLLTHVRIHTGEKPHKCSYCTKCFTQASHLALHERFHIGDYKI